MGFSLGGLLLLVAVLLLVLFYTAPGRALVASIASEQVSKILGGTLEIGEIESLAPPNIVIRDIRLRDPQEREVLHLETLRVTADVWALLDSEVLVRAVVLEHPVVHLFRDETHGYSLIGAVTPIASDEAPPPPDDAPAAPWFIDVAEVRLEGGEVYTDDPDLAGLEVTDLDLVARMRMADALGIAVESLDFTVARGGEPIGGLESLTASALLDEGVGASTELHLALGDTRIDGTARLTLGDGDAPLLLDAQLEIDRFAPALLADFGLPELPPQVPSWVGASIDVRGALPSDLDATVDLRTPGGDVRVEAHMAGFDEIRATIRSDGLRLAEVSPELPPLAVTLGLRAEYRLVDDAPHVRAHLDYASIDDQPVPAFDLAAILRDDAVELEEFTQPRLGDGLSVSGRYAFDGNARVLLRIAGLDLAEESWLRAFAPDLAGRIDATIDATVDLPTEESGGTVVAVGEVRAEGVDVPGDIGVERLRLRFAANGDLLSPRATVSLVSRDLRLPGQVIRRVDLEVAGGPSRYTIDGGVVLPDDLSTDLDLAVVLDEQRFVVDGEVGLDYGGGTIAVDLDGVRVDPETGVRARGLVVRSEDIDLSASGEFRFDGPADLELDLTRFDLSMLDGRRIGPITLPNLPSGGIVSATVSFEGTPDRPVIDASVDVRDVGIEALALGNALFTDPPAPGEATAEDAEVVQGGPEIGSASLSVDLQYGDGRLASSGRADLGPLLQAEWQAEGTFSRRLGPAQAVERANWDISLSASSDDLSFIRTRVPAAPIEGGAMRLDVQASGTLDDPQIDATFTADDVSIVEREPIDVRLTAHAGEDDIGVDLDATDTAGVLVDLDAGADFGLGQLMGGDTDLTILDEATWHLYLRVPERDAETFGVSLGPLDDYPTRIAVAATIDSEAGAAPRGEIAASVTVALDEERDGISLCGADGLTTLTARANFAGGAPVVEVEGTLDGRTLVAVQVEPSIELPRWSAITDLGEIPEFAATIDIDRLDLAEVPVLCRDGSGHLSLDGTLEGILGAAPRVELRARGEQLAFQFSEALDLELEAHAEGGGAAVQLVARPENGGQATLDAALPIAWGGDLMVPEPGEGELSASLVIDDFATASLANYVPVFRRGRGRLDGRVDVVGPLDALVPTGELTLDDVTLALPGVDQRLSNTDGRIVVERDRVVLDHIRARDSHGSIGIGGTIALENLFPRTADIQLTLDEFPMRQAGTIMARLTSRATVTADVGESEVDVELTLREVAVELPEQLASAVQSLAENPDITIVDSLDAPFPPPADEVEGGGSEVAAAAASDSVVGEIADAVEVPEALPPPPFLVRVHVDATSPFFVRRSDFAIQLAADLLIEIDERGTRLNGEVDLRRGTLDLIGKTFELREGSIRFDGGSSLDPILELVAEHELSRYPGEVVRVSISGRLSRPDLRFTSTLPEADSQGEVVQLLVTGRIDDADASTSSQTRTAGEQAASILGGLTAGILSVAARSELGDNVPVIAVSTGDDLGEVGVRAGFVVDRLIPDFLEGIVTGAYVEGYIQSEVERGGEDSSNQWGAVGGFLLELYFPSGFLTSSSFQPPANWSFDVLWRP